MTIFVNEDIESSSNQKIFTLLGVDYLATPRAWISFPTILFVGIAVAIIFAPTEQLFSRIIVGILYGLLILLEGKVHDIGHILSSRMVNAPVKTIIMTSSFNIMGYDDDEEYPSHVHVGRSLGGPVANILVGSLSLIIYSYVVKSHYLLFFGDFNLIVAFLALLPIPSVDGSVILRELRDWKS